MAVSVQPVVIRSGTREERLLLADLMEKGLRVEGVEECYSTWINETSTGWQCCALGVALVGKYEDANEANTVLYRSPFVIGEEAIADDLGISRDLPEEISVLHGRHKIPIIELVPALRA